MTWISLRKALPRAERTHATRAARRNRRSPLDVLLLEERRLLSSFERSSLLTPNQVLSDSYDLSRLSDDLVDLYAAEARGMTLAPISDAISVSPIP